jgi:Tol biopolymer transport system component/SAM-dependent methyltransferase
MWKIKPEYRQRDQVEYYEQKESTRIHQPHVYGLAKYFCERLGTKYIIDIGCGNGAKLQEFPPEVQKIGIDFGTNLELFEKNNPGARIIEINFEEEIPKFDDELIANSVVICADVLEHLHSPDNLLKYLAKLSYQAQFVLISTPDRVRLRGIGDLGPPKNPWHLREWSSDELHDLFDEYKFKPGFWGYTINNNELLNKTTSLYIGGRLNGFQSEHASDLSAVAIISVFNEIDIITQTIRHYLNHGLHVHILDNWSDNGTFEKVERLARTFDSLTFERFPPQGSANTHVWKDMLDRKAAYSVESGFDWGLHVDVDELFFSPWPEVSLLDGIKIIDAMGFNAFELTRFEFRPIKAGFSQKKNPKKFFNHFEFSKSRGRQVKAWKIIADTSYDLSSKGGHLVQFPGQKIYPLKFENHHFPYRSLMQMKKKLYSERLPRIEEGLTQRGWHNHFVDFAATHGLKLWKPDQLMPESARTREEYLVERLSGVGITTQKRDWDKIKKQYSYYLSGKIETFEDMPFQLMQENEALRAQIELLNHQLSEIKNTRSWRLITALMPIRSMLLNLEQNIFLSKKKEKREHIDPSTGAKIIQWTDSSAKDQHLYFTSPSVTDDNKWLVFISDRDGFPNLYKLDKKTGQIHQLTDNQEGLLKSYPYPSGTSRGLSKSSPCLDSQRKLLYYNQSGQIFSIQLDSGIKKHLFDLPQGWVSAYTHVSHSGERLCVPITEPQHFTSPARNQGEQMRNLGEIEKKTSVFSRILIINTLTGDLVKEIRIPFWVTHVQFCPEDDNKIIFNHEGLRENIFQRIWALEIDSGAYRPLFKQNQSIWCTHEIWMTSGQKILYHGGERENPKEKFIACRNWDGALIFKQPVPDLQIVHAVPSKNDSQVIVDQRDGWISIINLQENISIRLCELHTDFRNQDTHAHPVQSKQGQSVVFTSNEGGACNIYEVYPPE